MADISYKRECTRAEKDAFADAYRLYERYAAIEKLDVNDDKQVNAFLRSLVMESDSISEKGLLYDRLVFGVIDYFDKWIMLKRKEGKK